MPGPQAAAGGEAAGHEAPGGRAPAPRAAAGPAGALGPRLLAVALLVPTAGVLPAFLVGGLAVQVQADLGFGEAGIGASMAAFFGAAALASAAAGRLVHRIGPARSLRIGGAVAAVTLLGVAGLARSLGTLLAWLVAGGTANALCQPGVNDLLAREIRVERQGLAFAIKQSAIPLGTLLGGLAVPAVALTVGWRWAFVAGAALAVAAIALVRGGPGAAGGAEDRRAARPVPLRPLLVLAAAGGFGATAGSAIGSFLVASAVNIRIAERAAGLLLAGSSVLILATRLAMGLVADRRGRQHFELVSLLLAIGSIGFALLASTSAALFVAGAAVAAAAGWGWPGLFNLAVVGHDRALAAVATGITQTGVYAGAVAGPVLFGLVAERRSFAAAWLLIAAAALLGAGMVLLGRRRLAAAARAAATVGATGGPAAA
ncbi:MAG TPA: MFS transporter [Actinomycetes bacterium]|nr:MFS transporter [Actinomycetes bacterium]